jgi:hypothetical protein
MRTAPADGDGECEWDAEGDAVDEEAARDGEDAGLAVVIPALHAARDRPAAQVVTTIAVRRYMLM